MNAFFDIRTLHFAISLITITLSLCFLYVYLNRKTYAGFGHWTVSAACGGLGFALISFRGILPALITIPIANVLLMMGIMLQIRGLDYFCEDKPKNVFDLTMMIVFFLGVISFTYIWPDTKGRVVLIYIFSAIYWGRGALITWFRLPHVLQSRSLLLAISFGVLSIQSAQHALTTLLFDTNLISYMQAGPIQGVTSLLQQLIRLFIVFGLISINSQRLEMELKAAEKEIKVLSGLLPVCANCKKIRDESGAWQVMEEYIGKRAEVMFTHGLCPDCIRALYPDLADSILDK